MAGEAQSSFREPLTRPAPQRSPHPLAGGGFNHAQLAAAGVHVTVRPLRGPWAAGRAALVTRWPDDTWTVDVAATATPAAARHALATVAALREHGAGNTGWTPGPGGTLWRYL